MQEQESFIKKWGVKPLLIGIVVGGLGIIASPLAMWNASAEKLASDQASVAVITALTPVCVSRASSDPNYPVLVADFDAASSFNQTKIVTEAGWANMPGTETANRKLAEACAKGILDAIAAPSA